MEIIKVGMADLAVAKSPHKLITLGLGSCIGIVLYDSVYKIGGLAHIMLPSSKEIRNNSNKAKFADTAIDILIDKMLSLGAKKNNIRAKIAGGSQMFSFNSKSDVLKIGERNANASRKKLSECRIPIICEDCGGNYGRTIELNTKDGSLLVRTIGYGTKII